MSQTVTSSELSQTAAGQWLQQFLQLYAEESLPELVAFLQGSSAPDLEVAETDLLPVTPICAPQGDWLAPLLYLNRGLKIEAVHEATQTQVSVTAREQYAVVSGRVRVSVRLDAAGQLIHFHMASIHDGHRFVTVPTRPAARASVWSAAQSYVEGLAHQDLFSGCVLVQGQTAPLFQVCAGAAQQAPHVPVTLDTRFNLASITKAFTAVALLRLVQAGNISLQEEVNAYLPEPVATWQGLTLHELLTHTAGFGPAVLTGDLHWLWKDRCREMGTWWNLVRRLTPNPAWRGEWHYSNVGYVILGMVLQHVSALDYYHAVQQLVFDPAGMLSAAFDELDLDQGARAVGYDLFAPHTGTVARPRRNHLREVEVRGGPHGYAYASVTDLALFVRACLTGPLLDSAHRRLLRSTSVPTNRPDSSCGYGLFQIQSQGRELLHLSGAGPGISAWLDVDPARDLTTVVLSNYGSACAHRVGHELRSLLIQV